MANRKRTILLYGRTRSGKTTLIGELAEFVKKSGLGITRLYTIDRGGTWSIQPYIELGVVEVVAQEDTDPWTFLHHAVRGHVRDDKRKWVNGDNGKVGLFAFESMTAWADALMESLAEKAANGLNVGGTANVNFTVGEQSDVILKVGGNNQSHYNVVQTRITGEVWKSQNLVAPYILWTASVAKDDDQVNVGKVLGPAVTGKALTAEVPRWFDLTFRVDAVPAPVGGKEKHIIYLGNSTDTQAGNAVTLGNTRTCKDAPELPTMIEPASLVQAIQKIDGGYNQALNAVKARLAAK
jgi:hypothetical protein